jgi:hypothetical protein
VLKLPVILIGLGTMIVLGIDGVLTGEVDVSLVFIRISLLPDETTVLPSGLKSI